MNYLLRSSFLLAAILFLPYSQAMSQTVVAGEDFDGGDVNLISGFNATQNVQVPPFRLFGIWQTSDFGGANPTAPFTLTDDTVGDVSGAGSFEFDFEGIFGMAKDPNDTFFAVCSFDEFFEANESVRTGTWTFDVSSASDTLTLSIDMGQLSTDSFDGVNINNSVNFEYRFNGTGAFQTAFSLEAFELVGTGFE
ncbi:MAG: hypothetical protein AAGA30_09340, partial [Planctomycetota bacterium]